jgi:hypothetical protein
MILRASAVLAIADVLAIVVFVEVDGRLWHQAYSMIIPSLVSQSNLPGIPPHPLKCLLGYAEAILLPGREAHHPTINAEKRYNGGSQTRP